jgi:hypothetical protein
MSAIAAGKECKSCKTSFYFSFGHPKWYDDVLKYGVPESETFKEFRKLQLSGFCPDCYSKLPDSQIGEIVHRNKP